jgi:hypothetical protein
VRLTTCKIVLGAKPEPAAGNVTDIIFSYTKATSMRVI